MNISKAVKKKLLGSGILLTSCFLAQQTELQAQGVTFETEEGWHIHVS